MMSAQNKEAAVSFLKQVTKGDIRGAYETYIGQGFRHHNPYYEGSAKSLMEGMEQSAKELPIKELDVKHVFADGDYVAVHSHVQIANSSRGFAVVHILRLEDGRIVEFWDIGQDVPEKSPNQYGMF